jgi:hypothetical protein
VLPYWLLFTIFAAGSLQYRRQVDQFHQSAPLLGAAAFFTALMIGFRFEVGGDWDNYVGIYEFITEMDFINALGEQDPGYALINWVAGQAGVDIWAVNLACALIFCWGLAKFARSQPNPWLAILVAVPYLIIVVAMGYTRQAVAIGLVLAGLSAVQNGAILRFSVYLLFAVLFHKSAIIVLPLVTLAATQRRIVIFPMMAVTGLLLYYLFVSASIDRLMNNYVEQEYESQGAAIRVAMNLPPAAIYLLFQRRFGVDDQQRKLWRNFALAAFFSVVLLVGTASSTAVDRLALYLIPLQMFVLARMPHAFSNQGAPSGAMVLFVIAYSAVIQFVWLNYAGHSELWVPYQVYPLLE